MATPTPSVPPGSPVTPPPANKGSELLNKFVTMWEGRQVRWQSFKSDISSWVTRAGQAAEPMARDIKTAASGFRDKMTDIFFTHVYPFFGGAKASKAEEVKPAAEASVLPREKSIEEVKIFLKTAIPEGKNRAEFLLEGAMSIRAFLDDLDKIPPGATVDKSTFNGFILEFTTTMNSDFNEFIGNLSSEEKADFNELISRWQDKTSVGRKIVETQNSLSGTSYDITLLRAKTEADWKLFVADLEFSAGMLSGPTLDDAEKLRIEHSTIDGILGKADNYIKTTEKVRYSDLLHLNDVIGVLSNWFNAYENGARDLSLMSTDTLATEDQTRIREKQEVVESNRALFVEIEKRFTNIADAVSSVLIANKKLEATDGEIDLKASLAALSKKQQTPEPAAEPAAETPQMPPRSSSARRSVSFRGQPRSESLQQASPAAVVAKGGNEESPTAYYHRLLENLGKDKIAEGADGELLTRRSGLFKKRQGTSDAAKKDFQRILKAAIENNDKNLFDKLRNSKWGKNVMRHHPDALNIPDFPVPEGW